MFWHYLRLPGDNGHGEGVIDCLWAPSEPQFDSLAVSSSVLSNELLCLDIEDSTGTSARPITSYLV